MEKRLTIKLTEAEYDVLFRASQQERRTPKEQAAHMLSLALRIWDEWDKEEKAEQCPPQPIATFPVGDFQTGDVWLPWTWRSGETTGTNANGVPTITGTKEVPK